MSTVILDYAILIHGINPDLIPGDSIEALDEFLSTLCAEDPELAQRFPPERVIPIRWGHPLQSQNAFSAPFRSDEQLFVAQNRILQTIAAVEPDLTPDDHFPWSRAKVAMALQRNLLISGFGDMVYFTGRDGYQAIQRIIFQALRQRLETNLPNCATEGDHAIRLHLFAESLGVSIGFEFLSLLFGPALKGHQLEDVLEDEDLAFYQAASSSARKLFTLGTFVAAASQLPLLLQRRQHAIEQLARIGYLDPSHIGLTPTCDRPRWLLFHDPRDILSMPTKPLFGHCPWIQEEWVENRVSAVAPADRFEETHNGYWCNPDVIASTRHFLRVASGSLTVVEEPA